MKRREEDERRRLVHWLARTCGSLIGQPYPLARLCPSLVHLRPKLQVQPSKTLLGSSTIRWADRPDDLLASP